LGGAVHEDGAPAGHARIRALHVCQMDVAVPPGQSLDCVVALGFGPVLKEAERAAKEAALARVRELEAELLRVTRRTPRRTR
jgi:hypothetical protein